MRAAVPRVERRRVRRRRRVPKYMRRKDGKLRRMPARGRCTICEAPLTLGPTAVVCSNPRCSASPLVPISEFPRPLLRLMELRLEWPELIDD